MTNELSVEEAVELLKEKRMEINYKVNGTTQFSKALDLAIKALEQQPKIGKWIWQTEDIYKCSECGEDIHVKEVMNKPQYVCCPMCGVKMEVEKV